MTLVQRCQGLQTQIDRRNELRRAHKDAEVFRERESLLKSLQESLRSTIEKLEVLKSRDLGIGNLPDTTVAMRLLKEHRQAVAINPLEPGKEFTRLKRSIEKINKELIELAERAIEFIKRDLPSIEEPFLKQVEGIPGYQHQVSLIRVQRDALLNGIDPIKMDAADLAQFLDRRASLRELANQLNPSEFPKEITDFFRSLRQPGGAPLAKLTDTVRQWLVERDQLKNIRITIVGQ